MLDFLGRYRHIKNNNQCIKNSQTCNQECSNHNQRRCVENQVYLCHLDNNGCWIENSIDSCPTSNFWYCVNGQCIQQVPNGCKYGNPTCTSGEKCDVLNNKCVKDEGVCYPDCNNLQQKWCNGNVAMGCYKVNNCLKGRQIEICSNDEACVNGKCVSQQELGCKYHNPDCESGKECINNQCAPKQSVCIAGWKCKDGLTPGYQNIYCEWEIFDICPNGCEDGHCKQSSANIQKASEHPILFVHGHSVISGTNTADENLDDVKDIRNKLVRDYGTFYGVQAIPQGMLNEKDVERWCTETEQCLKKDSCRKNNGKSQRIVGFSYYYGSDVFHTNESKSITEYSDDLNKAINMIYQCTHSKINIITSSMGGLVAREYLRKFGDSKVHKLIMLGTPNKGIGNKLSFLCSLPFFAHPGPECQDMQSDSEFIKHLNTYKSDTITYVAIAGDYSKPCPYPHIPKNDDCVVDISSALLDYAYQYIVDCYHEDLRTDKCPMVYQVIKEVLEDDYTHAINYNTLKNGNTINQISEQDNIIIQQKTNQQPKESIQQQSTIIKPQSVITHESQSQKIIKPYASNSQVKSTSEKPKEKQSAPQKQEQKKEEPKNFVSILRSWFSSLFG